MKPRELEDKIYREMVDHLHGRQAPDTQLLFAPNHPSFGARVDYKCIIGMNDEKWVETMVIKIVNRHSLIGQPTRGSEDIESFNVSPKDLRFYVQETERYTRVLRGVTVHIPEARTAEAEIIR